MSTYYSTLLDGFDAIVARNPTHPCLTFMGKTTDFAHVQKYAKRFAAFLRRIGVQRGERVMIHLPPCPQFTIAYLGCFYAGAVAVPFSPAAPKGELAKKMEEYGVVAIVTMDIFAPVVNEALAGAPVELRILPIVASIPEFLPIASFFFSPRAPAFCRRAILSRFYTRMERKYKMMAETKDTEADCENDADKVKRLQAAASKYRDKAQTFRKAQIALENDSLFRSRFFSEIVFDRLLDVSTRSLENVRPKSGDLAQILSTGGTTGGQKGVMLSHGQVVVNACQCLEHFLVEEGKERFYTPLPLDHAFALTVGQNGPLLSASEIIFQVDPSDFPAIKKDLWKIRPTYMIGVPVQYAELVKIHHGADWSSLTYAISGGSALSRADEEAFNLVVGKEVIRQGTGTTELGPVIACNPPIKRGRNKMGSCGMIYPYVEVRIMEEKDGQFVPVPPGVVGRIFVKTPAMMMGYWNNTEATAEVITPDDWFMMSDFGYLDEDNYIYFKGRTDDTIVDEKGRKLYPDDIENALREHCAVEDVVAVPIDGKFEAFVVLRAGYAGSEDISGELMEFVSERVERYNVPKQIHFRTELPKTRMKKPIRYVLRDEILAARAKESR